MLVLLPPSETKSVGGKLPPLDLSALSAPELTETRRRLIDALVHLSADTEASKSALGLSNKQIDEIGRNRMLLSTSTTPALQRYTGVLYDALAAKRFTRVQRDKAMRRLAIGSALFGISGAADPIPAYRLSGGNQLPNVGTLAAVWKPTLSAAIENLADGGLVVDLRSGSYRALGPVPGAVTADVVTEFADGSRKVVSHFNKHHKGLLARALVVTRAEPDSARAVARVARSAGLRVELDSPTHLTVVTA